jgi:hypothetical protein
MRRRDVEVGKLYVVRGARLGVRLRRPGWWAAHLRGFLQTMNAVVSGGSPRRPEPQSGTVLRAIQKSKLLGVTFTDVLTNEIVTASPSFVAPYEGETPRPVSKNQEAPGASNE